MDEKERSAESHHKVPAKLPDAAKKKPYEGPSWEVEEAQANAQTCAKADDTSCAAGPIQS